jgi:hypothetical protein
MNENDKVFMLLRADFAQTKVLLDELNFEHLLRLTSELQNVVVSGTEAQSASHDHGSDQLRTFED